jgi:hypothetical protein
MDSAVLDDIIARLLEVRTGRPGKQVQLSEAEIRQLCVASKDIFLSQPNLLELEAPIKICGMLLISYAPFNVTNLETSEFNCICECIVY